MIFNARGRWLAALGLVATTGLVTLAGQGGKPGVDESMGELVAEIRALRLAVERSMATTSRAQLVLGRVQLQESRLATLGQQLQEARMRFLDAQSAQGEAERTFRMMIDMLENASTPNEERHSLQAQIALSKDRVKEAQSRTEQLRVDYTAAADALTAEQTRWSDFNDRLEALERSLATQSAR